MATLGGTPDYRTLTIKGRDSAGETLLKSYVLSGTVSNEDIEQALTDLDDVTNCAWTGYVTDTYLVSAMSAVPATSPHKYVHDAGWMTFVKTHPLNASMVVKKQLLVPSITASLFDDATHDLVFGDPDAVTPTASDKLARLRDFFLDNLTYVAVNGTAYDGYDSVEDSGLYGLGADVNGV
jgi:hypothetical protein